MNKKVVGIICGVVVVAGLSGALVALKMTDGGNDSVSDSSAADSSSAAETTVLSQKEADDVTSVLVTNQSGSFEVVRTSTAEESETGSAVFNIAGFDELSNADTSMIGTLVNNVATLSSDSTITEHCEDLGKYGLENPAASATMTFEDGSTFSFRIGDTISGGGTYFTVEGTDTVYAVQTSLVSNYQKEVTGFLSTTVLEEPAEEAYPIVESVLIQRQDMDYDIVLKYDNTANEDENLGGTAATHVMTEPVAAYLSVERSTDITNGMFGLRADSIVKPHPTQEDLQEAGLRDDTCFGTVTMVCDDGNTYVLRIGNRYTQEEENAGTTAYYNIYLEGLDVIFSIQEENLPWSTVEPTDIASKLIFVSYVWDIGELKVEARDMETMDFVGSGTGKDDYVVTLNGEACDQERFRTFYSFLLNASAEQIVLDETPQGDPLATITLKLQKGGSERTVSFYQKDDFTCLISINGETAYTCRLSFLQTLLQNMERFDTDEEFVTSWS